MNRWFNTAGPCDPEIHYMLSPHTRLPQVERLIQQRSYFVLYAPHQTGKTTAMLSLARELTASGQYVSVLLSVEAGSAFNQDPLLAEGAILGNWYNSATARLPVALHPTPWPDAEPGSRIRAVLQAWAREARRPLVVFIDEIDSLRDETLIMVLRQLRDGYADRPHAFPHSLALIGLRDVRDYKVASEGRDRSSPSNPFNVKAESITLRPFARDEVAMLYQQHTNATGQLFTPEATARAFALTQGQPWLVNALARQVVEVLVPNVNIPITVEHIGAAKELLIERQDTHLDSLAERLCEPRVRHIIEPMLAGRTLEHVPPDDIRFVLDLGLCRLDLLDGLIVANPIYQEVLPRVLATTAYASIPRLQPDWLTTQEQLDIHRLLEAFLTFWRQHGEMLLSTAPYQEIAPHIVLMAFLQRVVDGKGTLEREYAIGSGRMNICLRYGPQTVGMAVKVWRAGRPDPLAEGLTQLDGYLDGLGLTAGWLIIFDQRSGLPPIAERTTTETATTPDGRAITAIRG